jgi:hypothetical protein
MVDENVWALRLKASQQQLQDERADWGKQKQAFEVYLNKA